MAQNLIYSINGPVVTIKGKTGLSMMEMVHVGNDHLVGEVIRMDEELTTIQVYEETSGLAPGEPVTTTGGPLCVTLGPGILRNIYDGIQRPLPALEKESGPFIARGCNIPSLDPDAKWDVTVTVKVGDKIVPGQIYATCPETPVILHKCMAAPGVEGTVTWVAENGSYTVKVFENTTGNKYAQAYSTTVDMTLRNVFLPYLYPNQYVNYTADCATVKKAAELTAGKTSDLDKISAVYYFVTDNFTYDYNLANTVQSGYLPNVDQVVADKKGICFDYASVMAAMLRSQGIPTKLVTGYVAPNNAYHAWNEVWVEGKGWVKTGSIYFDGVSWTLMDPTFTSAGKGQMERARARASPERSSVFRNT